MTKNFTFRGALEKLKQRLSMKHGTCHLNFNIDFTFMTQGTMFCALKIYTTSQGQNKKAC